MTKHTPGPWKRQGQFVSDNRETLAGMYAVRNPDGDVIGAFDLAEDADLAAAAPAMLAVLKKAFANKDAALHGNRPVFNDLQLAGEMRAAIAAAEGRTDA